MDENEDVQNLVKKIPAFTVLKNGSILKNIFLLRNPSPCCTEESAVNTSSRSHESNEEILLVGRHPNCNIILEHPSISRYHLRIHSNPSSHMLSVVDLSSVHGTWVSGKRIKPGVRVKLKEGDTVRMGGSSRIYELHWIPLSQAYNVDDPLVPAVYTSKEGEEQTNQLCSDDLGSSNFSCSTKIQHPSLKKTNPLNDSNPSSNDADAEHFRPSQTSSEYGEIFSTVLVQVPLVVSGTMSVTENSDSLDKSETQSNWSRDNMSDEFEWLNHGTMKDDLVSVALSDATNKYGEHALNEDVARANETDTGSECELLNQQKTENGSVPVVLSGGVLVEESKAFMPDREGGKEFHIGDEFETSVELCSNKIQHSSLKKLSPLNDLHSCSEDTTHVEHFSPSQTSNEHGEIFSTVSVQVPVGVSGTMSATENSDSLNESETQPNRLKDNMSNEFGWLNHWTLKDDLPSVALSDATNKHGKHALNQGIAGESEIDMGSECELLNQQKIKNGAVPVALSDGVLTEKNEAFVPDRAQGKEVYIVDEFEQIKTKIMIESSPLVLSDGVENKLDDEVLCTSSISRGKEVDMGIKCEVLDQETMKKDSSFVVPPGGIDMDQEQPFTPDISRAKEVHMNLEAVKNVSVSMTLFDGLDGNEWEIFTPDKENNDPNACPVKSMKKRWKEDEYKQSNDCTTSKQAVSSTVNVQKDIPISSKTSCTNIGERYITVKPSKILSSSERKTKSGPMNVEGSCKSINDPQTIRKFTDSSHNILGGAKKRWTMVVDTNSLLDYESLKHLKILQGLKGTRLFVPTIVVRELMDIKGRHGLLKRSTEEVCVALNWIEECMVNTRWWIHMDEENLHSSTTEPEVLQTVLQLRSVTTAGEVIILSNDLTLKIKAMAEGVICEKAEEFRRSLVNPFSERFMWVGSLARGPTWSCVDDAVLRQKYHNCPLHATHALKGLRLLAGAATFR